ncbi:MAG: EFR1 family ferrodoxin [Candidatus Omnitrophota bacterium]
MSYKRLLLYCFSGTGNTYRAACWIRQAAEARGMESRLVLIDRLRPQDEIDDDPETLVGVAAPTHGFTTPWLALRFAARLPRKKRAHAFCLATRAGLKFGPVFTPGISGTGTFLLALILFFKGYRVRGSLSLDMPSNWIAFHSGLKTSSVDAIIQRAEPTALRFADKIFSCRKVWFTWNNLYELIWGILLSPISLIYLLAGRFYLAKLFLASNRCNGCGLCAERCPVQAIKMVGASQPRPFWKYKCESCMRCMAYCPERAVEASHSWAVVLYKIASIPLVFILLRRFGWSPVNEWFLHNSFFQQVFDLLNLYLALIVGYYGFHFLTRNSFINNLFSYTTLTRLYRRYREPHTSIKDIAPATRK